MCTLLLGAVSTHAAVKTQEILYTQGDITLNGYVAYDDSIEGRRPGILVVHEWWGQNDYARKRAEMLAQLGYTALSIDMYGDGKTADHPDTAGEFSSAVMQDIEGAGKERFLAGLAVLKKQPTVDPEKIAAIGYCFGGGVVLHMARFGTDLDGVVSFHGSLGTKTPAQAGAVKARVLVCNGANDPFTPPEMVEAFKKEMDDAGVDYTFKNYPGAVHSFTNPQADEFGERFQMPLAYDQEADAQSWRDMQDFFKMIFK